MAESLTVSLGTGASVSVLVYAAERRRRGATMILGHGAGAGQKSRFMIDYAAALASRGLDAVTFNFPYTERGRRMPDRPEILEACYRAVIGAVRRHERLSGAALVIGGKSMGGRIASQVAAGGGAEVDGLAGLVFLGYPLHPPGRPQQLRTSHLPSVQAPMLFVQGSRDTFGTPDELHQALGPLRVSFDLHLVENGDHSFKVPKGSPVAQERVHAAIQDRIVAWIAEKV